MPPDPTPHPHPPAAADPVIAEITRLYHQRRGATAGRPGSGHHRGPRLRGCPLAYRIGELLVQQRVRIGPGRGRGNGYGWFTVWCAALPFTHAMIWQYIRAYTDWPGPPPTPADRAGQQPAVPQPQPHARPVPPPPRPVMLNPWAKEQERRRLDAEERAERKAVRERLRERRRDAAAEREAERQREVEQRQREAREPIDQARHRIARYLDTHGPTPGGDVADALGISRDRFWAAVHDSHTRSAGFELVFATPAGWSITAAGRQWYLAGGAGGKVA